MTSGQPPTDDETPAERRLQEHLELLRTDPPPSTALSVAMILRRARWQQAIRRPLLVISAMGASFAESMRLLLGPRGGQR